MKNKQPNTRRKALAILGGGLLGASQLPKAWTKPVVDAVVLPVHAQTTTDQGVGLPQELPTHFRYDIQFSTGLVNNTKSASGKILSVLIPDAQAGEPPIITSGDLMIDSLDGVSFTAKLNVFNFFQTTLTLIASGQIGGAAASLDAPQCRGIQGLGSISVSAIAIAGASYNIVMAIDSGFNGEISNGILPVGTGEPDTSLECAF